MRLTNVVDPDGRSTKLSYTNTAFTNLITQVMDPFGRTANLQYDANGCLTNITDVAGIASILAYDPGGLGWITSLWVPPYGTNAFRYGGVDSNSSTFFTGGGQVNRFVEITLPTGGQHLYLYRQDCSGLIPTSYSDMPATYDLSSTLDNVDQYNRNSFHWSPMQHDNLSGTYRQSGQPSNLTPTDYSLALLRRWLFDPNTGNAGNALSLERASTPDTNTNAPGQSTWYDYAGKPQNQTNYAGSTEFPSFIARVMPDGTSWYQNFQRNSYDLLGRLTNMVDGAGVTRYGYDGAGQPLSESGPWTGVSVSNTYTNRLRLALTVKTNGAAAWAQSYYYDPARRLTNVTSGAGPFGYTYTALRSTLPTLVTLSNGASVANSYDGVARLLSTTLKNSQPSTLISTATTSPASGRTRPGSTAIT